MEHPGSAGRDARLSVLVRRQAGAFSFAQAVAIGFPSTTIGRRLQARVWERRHPGVFVLAGAEPTRRRELWVALLAVGERGTITHESAATCHGAEMLPVRPVTLTVPHRGHHRLRGIVVHQIDDLLPSHRMSWNGLPVSRPARSVVELGATQPSEVVGAVMDDLVRLGRTTVEEVSLVFASVVRPGKPGMGTVARVLDLRCDGEPPAASELERALFSSLVAAGLPRPSRQVVLPGRSVGGVRGVVDAAYDDAMLIIEADGRRWHARVAASRSDKARDAQAARVGWQTIRFAYEQIVHDPAFVCDAILDIRAVRLRQLGRSAA